LPLVSWMPPLEPLDASPVNRLNEPLASLVVLPVFNTTDPDVPLDRESPERT